MAEPAPSSLDSGNRLAAVVLNFRTPELTRQTVLALAESERPIDQLVVVDNDPAGSSRSLTAGAPDRLVYLPNGANLGFSAGMNRGIRHALEGGARRILLVNSDALVAPDAIGHLESALIARPAAGIAAPLLLARANPRLLASCGLSFSPTSGRFRQLGFGQPKESIAGSPWTPLQAASGCVLLIDRQVFERTGLLDEEFFFSFEDLELCLRARRAGFEIGRVDAAQVMHVGGASMPEAAPERFYFAARNHLLAAERVAPIANRFGHWLRCALIIALNLAHAARNRPGPFPGHLRAALAGSFDYARRRFGAAGHAPKGPNGSPLPNP